MLCKNLDQDKIPIRIYLRQGGQNLPCPDALHEFRSGQDPNRNILLSGQDPNKNTYDIGTRQKVHCPDALHKFVSGQDPNKNIFETGIR